MSQVFRGQVWAKGLDNVFDLKNNSMNVLALRGLPFCQLVLSPNTFFTKMHLLWPAGDPLINNHVVLFWDIFGLSLLAPNGHRQIGHQCFTEWGRRLGWTRKLFKSYSLKKWTQLCFSRQMQEHHKGVRQLSIVFAIVCGAEETCPGMGNCLAVRRREKILGCDKLSHK